MRRSPVRVLARLAGIALALSAARAEGQGEAKTELGGLPLLGGDSDLGFGGGGFVSFARFEPGFTPYRVRLEVAGAITFKSEDDGLRVPYRDLYALWTLPQLGARGVRLELRVSYTNETTLAYYGIGNAARAPERGQPRIDSFTYGLVHPSLLLRLRLRIRRPWSLELGSILTYMEPRVRAGSLLARDAADPTLARFFGELGAHLVQVFEYGLVYDTRDAETSTQHGAFHQLRLRLSPGGISPFPYRYGQINLTLRFYTTHSRWTVAARIVGDLLFGDTPIYELPRYEDTFALGGANGVRGVPAQRYYGKLKLFGNLELRAALAQFPLLGLACELQGVVFFDAGRLWSDLRADPALDGRGVGLKLGLGGGLRLQQGQAFVVRADVAWSPDARPIGLYVTAGQMF